MFADRDRHARSPAHALALDCLAAGTRAAHPERVVREHVAVVDGRLRVGDAVERLADYDEVVVLGGGNAAGTAAAALEAVLGAALDGGCVVTDAPADTSRVDCLPGDHPLPTARTVAATERLLERARAADDRTLVLAVVTGGASALLCALADGLTLADLRATTDALVRSGATITEINAVRTHCSRVKGGRLAAALAPARVHTLVLSDVVGDPLDAVGSGPTVPARATVANARDVLDAYDLGVPASVREHLATGEPGTPRPAGPAFDRTATHLLASNDTAVAAAAERARAAGYEPVVLSARVRGEAREVAKSHVAVAEQVRATGDPVAPPAVVVAGGETTVTVGEAEGRGGPNLEVAASAGVELAGSRAVLASVDTDGSDGATDAAGALVDGATFPTRADRRDARRALRAHDTYPLLADAGALLETGATGTNVNDLRVAVLT
jgi:hydroxypyruvate reductase